MDVRPSLEWLIHPVIPEVFFGRYWEGQPLVVSRNDRDYFHELFSLDEVDRVLTTLDRRYPDVTLKNAARELSSDDYTVDGEVLDVARVYQLFAEGATIVLAFLDTVVPGLTALCRALEHDLSCPLQTNVYVTPAAAQGARVHYDTHDVFVLQVEGSKRWRIYGTPVPLPLRAQDFDATVHAPGELTREFELRAGDTAYIPRGVVHEAQSTDRVSLHITTGILAYTWTDLALEVVARAALQTPAFRRSLPPGFAKPDFDRVPARRTLDELLAVLRADNEFDAALEHFIDEALVASPPLLRGQLAQMASLQMVDADSVAGARPDIPTRVRMAEDALCVDCYGREIRFPGIAADAVRFALDHPRFIVKNLPGSLDEASKLTVVRRLIREGLVRSLPKDDRSR